MSGSGIYFVYDRTPSTTHYQRGGGQYFSVVWKFIYVKGEHFLLLFVHSSHFFVVTTLVKHLN